jgi:hypothetical protein
MKPQGRLVFERAAGKLPGECSLPLAFRKLRHDCQIAGDKHLRGIDLCLLNWQEAADARALQPALARTLRLLIRVVLTVMVMTARGPLGNLALGRLTLYAPVRMVPAASKDCMDGQQGSQQVSEKCVHRFSNP